MREILFRGIVEKDRDRWNMAGKFAYGLLTRDFDGDYMIATLTDTSNGVIHQYIKEETLGQFTGLLDKNGKKIFEGDIVKYIDKPHEWHFFITNQHNKYYGIFQKCIYRNFESVENKLGEKEYVFGDFYDTNEISEFVYVDSKRYEIIGNIHEVKE